MGVLPSGEIAFLGFDPSSATSGIFLNSAGQSRLLLNASTPAPGGGTFNNVSNLALNSLDQAIHGAVHKLKKSIDSALGKGSTLDHLRDRH